MEPIAQMTREQAVATIRTVEEIQTVEGLADDVIAAVIGLSASTWNRAKRGVYTGKVVNVGAAAARWLAERGREAPIAQSEYVPTSITRLMLTICQRATDRRTIGLIVAPAGTGKTLALREYARRLGEKALLLRGSETCRSRGAMAWELVDRLGIRVPVKAGVSAVYKTARDRLARMYAGGRAEPVTIIADETTLISPEAVNLLRGLHDDPDCRCPLVLADTWALHSQVHAARGLPGGYEQLRSRMGIQYLLRADTEIALDDVRAVAESILRANGGGNRMPARAVAFLHRNVANRPVQMGARQALVMRPGALRNVMQRMHNVIDVCRGLGTRPQWTPAELDHVADLVDMQMTNPDTPSPFGAAAEPAGPPAQGQRAAG